MKILQAEPVEYSPQLPPLFFRALNFLVSL